MKTSALPEDVAVARQFAQELRSKLGDALKRAVLFGSRAKGTALPGSDYDIVVVLARRDRNTMEQIYDDALEVLLQNGVDLSVKVYAEADFHRKMKLGTPFMAEIQQTGIDL